MAGAEENLVKVKNLDKVSRKFLAIDLGAESGRAFVGILESGRISIEEIHRFPNVPVAVSGHAHWDVYELFEQVKKSLKLAVEKGHGDIVSVGVDTWGVDFGLAKPDGTPMDMPFTYRDSRTNGMTEKVFTKIPRSELYSKTGIQMMQINSVFQLYSMKEDSVESLDEADKLLFTPDIFNYFLTGQKVSEYTIASTSQLLNASTSRFDQGIFAALGLPIRLMCPIVMPGTVVGRVIPEVASAAGLKDVDVVAVGSHDTASAVAAVPATGNNWAFLSSGTWSLIGVETDKPIINDKSLMNNFTNEGGVGGTITFLQNISGLWLLQELRRVWRERGEEYSYDELVSMARDAGEFKCILDPSDDSFLNPPDMEAAIIGFCGKRNQQPPLNKGEFVKTVFESLALKYRSAIRTLGDITGRKIEKLHIVGGGARNEMLNQFTADAAGIPVVAGPVEATVLGNIMVQAIAKGGIDSLERGREIIRRSFQVKEYLPNDSRKWDEASERVGHNS